MPRGISAIFLSPLASVKAETIILDGVLDETPNKSYSTAGGGVRVSFWGSGGRDYATSGVEVADKNKYSPKSYDDLAAFRDFGEGRKCAWTTYPEVQANENLDPTATELTIQVFFIGEIVERPFPHIQKVMPRDLQNPLNYTFRVAVTEYTPGVEGKLGTAKAEIRVLEGGAAAK